MTHVVLMTHFESSGRHGLQVTLGWSGIRRTRATQSRANGEKGGRDPFVSRAAALVLRSVVRRRRPAQHAIPAEGEGELKRWVKAPMIGFLI